VKDSKIALNFLPASSGTLSSGKLFKAATAISTVELRRQCADQSLSGISARCNSAMFTASSSTKLGFSLARFFRKAKTWYVSFLATSLLSSKFLAVSAHSGNSVNN